ncbi:MAG: hypothetical protein GX053_15010 [Tissierella sp.]|nr:hypothetical protein [Tissierella sp.]
MRIDKQIKGDIITVLVTSILIFSFLNSNYLLLYLSLGLLIVNVIWSFLKKSSNDKNRSRNNPDFCTRIFIFLLGPSLIIVNHIKSSINPIIATVFYTIIMFYIILRHYKKIE